MLSRVLYYVRILLNILIPLACVICVIFFAPKLLAFFMPFIIGFLLSVIANPLVRTLEKYLHIVRRHSSVFIVVSVLAVILFAIYISVSFIVVECIKFAQDFPVLYETVSRNLEELLDGLSPYIKNIPSIELNTVFNYISDNFSKFVGTIMKTLGEPTVNIAAKIPNFFINVLFITLSSYFFIAKREMMIRFLEETVSSKTLAKVREFSKHLYQATGGYFIAQLKIMLIIAMILLVGFWILHVKYAFLFSFLIAFLDFLPIFGTGTILLPWAVIEAINHSYSTAVGLVITYLITLLVRQLVQAKIVGDTMGIDPMLTLLLLFLGYRYSGVSGMIIAVPVGLIILECYRVGMFNSLLDNFSLLIREINRFRKKVNPAVEHLKAAKEKRKKAAKKA